MHKLGYLSDPRGHSGLKNGLMATEVYLTSYLCYLENL